MDVLPEEDGDEERVVQIRIRRVGASSGRRGAASLCATLVEIEEEIRIATLHQTLGSWHREVDAICISFEIF